MSKTPSDYAVGYGRPPAHTQFRKGTCGNPHGRPPNRTAARLDKLIGAELLRPIQVREGERSFTLPMLAAVLRQTSVQALKGSLPAQRRVLDMAQAIAKGADAKDAAKGEAVTLEMLVRASMREDQVKQGRRADATPGYLEDRASGAGSSGGFDFAGAGFGQGAIENWKRSGAYVEPFLLRRPGKRQSRREGRGGEPSGCRTVDDGGGARWRMCRSTFASRRAMSAKLWPRSMS
jgi:hypothetical protein